MKAVISAAFRQKLEYRLVHKEGMKRHEAKQAIEDMLIYLSDSEGSPGEVVDKAWHAAILYTADYRDFCLSNFGHFLDHVPVWPPQQDKTCNKNCSCQSHRLVA